MLTSTMQTTCIYNIVCLQCVAVYNAKNPSMCKMVENKSRPHESLKTKELKHFLLCCSSGFFMARKGTFLVHSQL
jgi:hypothetical protein